MSRSVLERILARKAKENLRRQRFAALIEARSEQAQRQSAAKGTNAEERVRRAEAVLRREAGAPPHVIAEIKFRSPSAGAIRARQVGDVARLAHAYAAGGASAISVLADGPGFGGSPLNLRYAQVAARPMLFKEFVLSPLQLDLARAHGASYVLLLVCALQDEVLQHLVTQALQRGLAPLVEAANEAELERALACGARLVGINARDLHTFRVDPEEAARCVGRIPSDRQAIYMSGIRTKEDFLQAAKSRADALLIGEGLMAQGDPKGTLRDWLAAP